MSLPISVTYTFANATTSTYLAYLDSNFTTVVNGINGIGNGTNSLSNVSITGGNVTSVTISGLTAPIAASDGGTGLSSPGTSGNVLASNGTAWISQANPASAGVIPATYSGLKVSASNTTSITVTANYVSLYSGSSFYTAASPSLTISTSTSGANGLDTGSIASNTWYYVYVIYNGTTVSGLISTSSTSPTLPSGYTFKARVGAVRYGASNLVPTIQYGNKTQYIAIGIKYS